MRKVRIIYVCLLVSSLFVLSGCGESAYDLAVKKAVDDGVISEEEVNDLKGKYAETQKQSVDSIENWTPLIEDLLYLDNGLDRHVLEKAIYGLKTKVIVYLDNTYSMRGYAQAQDPRAFTSLFEAISTYYSANPEIGIEARYVSKDNVAKEVGFNKMCDELTSHAWAKSSNYTDAYQMNDLFGAISRMIRRDDTKEEVICFFVSDMIPSTENEKIRLDRQTMLHFSERMTTMITDSLRTLSSKDGKYAAALYQFHAPFGSAEKERGRYKNEAIYYKFTNGHLLLHGEERPLYVMVIGNKYVVKEWNDVAQSGIQNFIFDKSSFIDGTTTGVQVNGYAEICEDRIEILNDDEGISLELSGDSIPTYLSFVDSALSVTFNDKLMEVDRYGVIKLGKSEDVDGGTLRIQLRDVAPKWIDDCSSEDDSKLVASNSKEMAQTFFLDKVFRAVVHGLSNATGKEYLYDKSYTIEIK